MHDNMFYGLEAPLDAIPSNGQVRAGIISGFGDFVRGRGSDPRRILDHQGLDVKALQDPDIHIGVQDFVDIFEYCGDFFDDPLFGLRLADRQGPEVFGCIMALCRAAPTVRDALTLFSEYIPVIHSPETTIELLEGEQIAELRNAPNADYGAFDQSNYQAVLLQVRLLEQICGPNFRVSYVNLNAEARARDIPEIETLLRSTFRTSPVNAVAFPAQFLNQPIAGADKLLFRLLDGYLRRVKEASRTTLIQRVEDYISGSLPSGTCSIGRCAKKLGISERTLQAHLNELGVRFFDILEQRRLALAQNYLNQSYLSLDEISFRLGYSEQSSFGRAFKRWTGTTPQNYQQRAGTPKNTFAA